MAARDLAIEDQETAEAVTTFLTDIFDGANPEKTVEHPLSARDLIDRGAAHIPEAGLGAGHSLLGLSLGSLGAPLIQLERYEESIPIEQRAFAIKEKVYGPDHLYVSMTLNGLANAHIRLHRCADARPLYQRAIDMKTNFYGADPPFNGCDECSFALSCTGDGERNEGLGHARSARAILEKSCGADDLRVAYAWDALGESHAAQDDHDRAIADYETAVRLPDSMGEHPVVGKTLQLYAKSLRAIGRDGDAGEAEARARVIRSPEAGQNH